MNVPEISTYDENGKEIGGREFKMKSKGRLNYNFEFKALQSSSYLESGYEYALAQVQISLERTEKSRKKIFGGYHTTTAIFAVLSLLSFFIQPEIVPG